MREAGVLLLLLVVALPARAGEAPEEDERWDVSLAPLFWFPGLSGRVEATREHERADDELGVGFLERLAAWHRGFGLLYEPSWLLFGDRDANGRVRAATTDLAAAFRIDLLGAAIEPRAGGRLVSARAELEDGGADARDRWVEPTVGVHAEVPVCDGLALRLRAGAGGFGIGSRLTAEQEIALSADLGSGVFLQVGWRRYTIDAPRGRFELDVRAAGPYVGIELRF